jgi:nicotinamidase-related amidase
MPGPKTIDKKKAAFIVMDFQVKIVSSFPPEFQKKLLTNVNNATDFARKEGMPVFFTHKGNGEPEFDIDPRIVIKPGEVVLTKKRATPFASTDIDNRLKKMDKDTIVLMGIHTSSCVLSTVRWAVELDYKIWVLKDCCTDREDALQQILYDKVFHHNSTVVDSEDFFALVAKS